MNIRCSIIDWRNSTQSISSIFYALLLLISFFFFQKEFEKTLAQLSTDQLFLMDPKQSWFVENY